MMSLGPRPVLSPVSGANLRTQGAPAAVWFRQVPARRTLTISHAYKGRGTDLSGVDAFRRHESDTGSSEFQIARLSARVTQLTAHLNEHKKDYASRRGLYAVLALRRRLLVYLERTDFPRFQKILQDLHLKPPKHNKTRR